MTHYEYNRIYEWFWVDSEPEDVYDVYVSGSQWCSEMSETDMATFILMVWNAEGCPKV